MHNEISNITCYRLENKEGDGLFFFKNGINKNTKEPSLEKHLYAFLFEKRFLEESYKKFYINSEYDLYELKLKNYKSKNPYGEITFYKKDIVSKNKINKNLLGDII